MKDRILQYEGLLNKCSRFDKKGRSMHYTSANGHMFSLLNKRGELGIRFPSETQKAYFEKYNTSFFKSHGAVMRGYITITEDMWADKDLLVQLLNESYDYVMSLDPK